MLMVPGGQAELVHTWRHRRKKEWVAYTRHRGFVRMAIEHGAALVPILAFGEMDSVQNLFDTPTMHAWTYKRVGFPLPYLMVSWAGPVELVSGKAEPWASALASRCPTRLSSAETPETLTPHARAGRALGPDAAARRNGAHVHHRPPGQPARRLPCFPGRRGQRRGACEVQASRCKRRRRPRRPSL